MSSTKLIKENRKKFEIECLRIANINYKINDLHHVQLPRIQYYAESKFDNNHVPFQMAKKIITAASSIGNNFSMVYNMLYYHCDSGSSAFLLDHAIKTAAKNGHLEFVRLCLDEFSSIQINNNMIMNAIFTSFKQSNQMNILGNTNALLHISNNRKIDSDIITKIYAIVNKFDDISAKNIMDIICSKNEIKTINSQSKLTEETTDTNTDNESIYVVSTKSRALENIYKIGYHTGTQKKLLSRYRTSLINPIIYFFINVDNKEVIEKNVHEKLKDYMILDDDSNKTEWFKVSIFEIVRTIETEINEN